MFFWLLAQFTEFPKAVGHESLSSENGNIFTVSHHLLSSKKAEAVRVLCLLQVYTISQTFEQKQDETHLASLLLFLKRHFVTSFIQIWIHPLAD